MLTRLPCYHFTHFTHWDGVIDQVSLFDSVHVNRIVTVRMQLNWITMAFEKSFYVLIVLYDWIHSVRGRAGALNPAFLSQVFCQAISHACGDEQMCFTDS